MAIDLGTNPAAVGVHLRRTMMLRELSCLLGGFGAELETFETYRDAVVQRNVLELGTLSNRRITWDNIAKLYGFRKTPVFRNFHRLWQRASQRDQPSLALVAAMSRDQMFRESGAWLSGIPVGAELGSPFFLVKVAENFPNRYSALTAGSLSRNLTSSWLQVGWIERKTMRRTNPRVGPGALALALFIAWLDGHSGEAMLATPISQVLLREIPEPKALLWEANRNSLLNYYDSGGISDIRFPGWLTKEEEVELHGAL